MLPKGSISKIYDYYFTAPQFKDEVTRALREFFNRPDLDRSSLLEINEKSEGLFNEWFLYDFTLSNGQTVLENFVSTNPFKLQDKEMELYRKLLNNKYGIFEVIDLELGKSIKLKDLQTGKEWLVQEHKDTFGLKKGYLTFVRIGEVGDHYELISADGFMIEGPSEEIEEMRKDFRNKKFKLTPKEVNEIFNPQQNFMVIEEKIKDLAKKNFPPMGEWEITQLPEPLFNWQTKKEARPLLNLVVHRDSYFIFNTYLALPAETNTAVKALLQAIEGHQVVPETLLVREKKILKELEPVAQALNFKIVYPARFKAIPIVLREMRKFF